MLGYITRRLGVLVVILLGSSFILYNAAALAGDPLEGLRESKDPRAKQIMISLTRDLQLDTPPPLRYFSWLRGVLGIFRGAADFGKSRGAQTVTEALATAIPTSIRLVFVATIVAMVLGISIGIITALRQYSRFDYAMTFVAFLLFSLPIFWVAVLLKQYMAISFNDFLSDPQISKRWLLAASMVAGVFWASIIGGTRKRVWSIFGIATGLTFGFVYLLGATEWFNDPYFGPFVSLALSVGAAFAVTQVSVGLNHKPSLYASLTMAGLGFVLYPLIQTMYTWPERRFLWPALFVLTLGIAALVGLFWAKIDRGPVIRTSMITSVFVMVILLVDKLLRTWSGYMATDAVNYRPIPTIGQENPLLERGNFWFTFLDLLLHLVLPTVALTLISFAGYVRYSRGTLLEVLNQDYIRTARAKGVPERTVIMRHAFRNTMIPLTTIIVVDFAGIIGGAIITEKVFGWKAVGSLFNQAVGMQDLNLLMGVFLVTSTLAVLANLVADLLYSALDPRIRVGGN